MNNSVFGKTVENLRKIINVRLVNNARNYIKYTSKPSFFHRRYLIKKIVPIYEILPVLKLNKPIYVGFSILDLRKL